MGGLRVRKRYSVWSRYVDRRNGDWKIGGFHAILAGRGGTWPADRGGTWPPDSGGTW